MHIFLTGETGVGKTTILQKVTERLQIIPGGFITYYGPDRYDPNRLLYINAAWKDKVFDPNHGIVKFRAGERPKVIIENFDQLGTEFIKTSKKWAPLLVMDECGRFEQQAEVFRMSVLECLNIDVPVLGVLRKMEEIPFLEQIKQHPKVKLIEVTVLNRNSLVTEISDYLLSILTERQQCYENSEACYQGRVDENI